MRLLRVWVMVVLVFGASLASRPAEAWPWQRVLAGCAAITAASAIALGTHYFTAPTEFSAPPEVVLATPATPPQAPEDTVGLRVEALSRAMGDAGLLELPLRLGTGAPFRFSLFQEGLLAPLIAQEIKEAIHREDPEYPVEELGLNRPGLHFRLDSLAFQAVPDTPGKVHVLLNGSRTQLVSAKEISKRDLVGGGVVPVVFRPESDHRPEGTAQFDAAIALRYDFDSRRFRIVEGEGKLSIFVKRLRYQATEPVRLPLLETSPLELGR